MGIADHTVMALGLLLGVACGALWQRLDRCDLAGVALIIGTVSGLVLAEQWMRQRVRP